MNEKALYTLIKKTLDTGLQARGVNGVEVRQADQPRKVGRPIGPAVLMSNVISHPLGHKKAADVWDAVNDVMTHTEQQCYATTIQFGTLWPQDPTDAVGYTALDLLKKVQTILQHDLTISAFIAAGVGIERPGDARQPYFKNEGDNFDADPSFDLVFTHWEIDAVTVPSTAQVEPGLYPV